MRAEAVNLRASASPISVRNLSTTIPDAVVQTLLTSAAATPHLPAPLPAEGRLLGMDRLGGLRHLRSGGPVDKEVSLERAWRWCWTASASSP